MLHLHALLGVDFRLALTPGYAAQPLVAFDVATLEAVVCWRSWTAQNHEPVLEPASLGKGAVSIRLDELVRVEILARRLASRHEKEVVPHQGGWVEETKDAIDDHGERDPEMVNGLAERDTLSVGVFDNMRQAGAYQVKGEQTRATDKGEEIAVVSSSNTVVKPHAVVVLGLDAVVAQPAVVCSRRSPKVACFAVFRRYFHRSS